MKNEYVFPRIEIMTEKLLQTTRESMGLGIGEKYMDSKGKVVVCSKRIYRVENCRMK